MKNFTLSICVPIFQPSRNHLFELLESIESIPRSIDVEVVFSIDGPHSEEFKNALGLIEEFKGRNKIVLHQNPRVGMVQNWNACVSAASGEHVLLVGQDDVVMGSNVEIFLEHSQVSGSGLIFGSQRYISSSGVSIGDPRHSVGPSQLPLEELSELKTGLVRKLGLLYGNIFADPCGALVRKETYDSVGLYSKDFPHSADIEYWMRVDECGVAISALSSNLSLRRIHAGNATRTHVRNGLANEDRIRLFRKYASIDSEYFYNRALTRLWIHWLYDTVRHRRVFERPGTPFLGKINQFIVAISAECLETLRLKSPKRDFMRLVS